jgi:hypothetical protein
MVYASINSKPCPSQPIFNGLLAYRFARPANIVPLILVGLIFLGCQSAIGQDAVKKAVPQFDSAHALAMYDVCRKWVTDGKVRPVTALWVRGCTAVRVTLRSDYDAINMGTGDAMASISVLPGAGNGKPTKVDVAALTRQATELALKRVRMKILNRKGKAAPGGPGASGAGQNKKAPGKAAQGVKPAKLPKLLVDVQFARQFEPIRLAPNDPIVTVNYSFAGGFHGLCMGRKSADGKSMETKWVWPATSLAMNYRPQYQISWLLRDLGYDAADQRVVLRLGRPGLKGLPLARFKVFHIVQPTPGLGRTELIRGHRIVKTDPFNAADMRGLTLRIANHLSRKLRKNGSMAGAYMPTVGKPDPETADAREQAFAGYVMGVRAAYLSTIDPKSAQCAQAKAVSRKCVEHIMSQIINEEITMDPAPLSLMLMTIVESPHLSDMKEQRKALAANLKALCKSDGTIKKKVIGPNPREVLIKLPTQVLILSALASYYEQTRDSEIKVKKTLDSARAHLWKNMDLTQIVMHLPFPWLLQLEQRMWRLDKVESDDPKRKKRTELFKKLVTVLRRKQITHSPEQGPADVIGGFALRAQPLGTAPNPDWRSSVVLAIMVDALDNDDLTKPADKIKWLLDCRLACRFLAQLMIDDPGGYYMRGLDYALGGIRLKLWDNKLAVWPSSMTLLAVTKLQQQMK